MVKSDRLIALKTLENVTTALKDRDPFILKAGRAGKMFWLRIGFRTFQGVHKVSRGRFGHDIAVKFALPLLRLKQDLLERRKLDLQINIRELRIRYLICQFGKNGFDLRFSTRLRRLEKSLKAADEPTGLVEATESAIRSIEGFIGGADQFTDRVKKFESHCANLQKIKSSKHYDSRSSGGNS